MNSLQVELNHDYTNCYVDPQGSDIEDGRLTLLIVLALQRANPEQKKLLNANYGCEEPEKVEIVKQVCTFVWKKNNEQKSVFISANFLLPLHNIIILGI